jgi:hypothetical protein
VPTAEIFGDLSSGFADRLDEMNQREAEVLVSVVGLA